MEQSEGYWEVDALLRVFLTLRMRLFALVVRDASPIQGLRHVNGDDHARMVEKTVTRDCKLRGQHGIVLQGATFKSKHTISEEIRDILEVRRLRPAHCTPLGRKTMRNTACSRRRRTKWLENTEGHRKGDR